ncbi:hypothetical protein K523DRAFT_326657 [Schizophyllum commune Tattone D]|nr:hypothetical protein K523DRAFT_326657 [Schizophyllum commune Tattone D]
MIFEGHGATSPQEHSANVSKGAVQTFPRTRVSASARANTPSTAIRQSANPPVLDCSDSLWRYDGHYRRLQ